MFFTSTKVMNIPIQKQKRDKKYAYSITRSDSTQIKKTNT